MLIQTKTFFPFIELFNQGLSKNYFGHLAHEGFFNHLGEEEYAHMHSEGNTYLDHVRVQPYPASLVKKHMENLLSADLNAGKESMLIDLHISEAKSAVRSFFNASDYECFFTKDTAHALELVANHYQANVLQMLLLADNHQVYDAVQYSRKCLKRYVYLNADYSIDAGGMYREMKNTSAGNSLMVLPGRSGVTGVKHDLSWIDEAACFGWDVFLDIDDLAPSARLDLKKVQPGFVGLTFQKMFGFPAGLGCLLVHRDKLSGFKTFLKTSEHDSEEYEQLHAQSIASVKQGLEFIQEIGMKRIEGRIRSMREYLLKGIKKIKHDTGHHVVKVFGNDGAVSSGTLLMNLYDKEGNQLTTEILREKARDCSITLNAGNLSNKGISQYFFETSKSLDEKSSMEDIVRYNDMVRQHNQLKSAVRIAVGVATRKQDLDVFLEFIQTFKNRGRVSFS